MNEEKSAGTSKPTRSEASAWWGHRLATETGRDRSPGKYDQFIDLVQQKYNYTRERAEEEFNRRMVKHEARPRQSGFRIRKSAA
jgi:hypothetical protein